VAAAAISTYFEPKQRSQLCIDNQSRDRAMTRPDATRNDFGTVRVYGWLVPVALMTKCAES
jgi:hypothetical protein